MPHKKPARSNHLSGLVKGHLRAALIALVFGMAAYGLIHILILIIRTIENL